MGDEHGVRKIPKRGCGQDPDCSVGKLADGESVTIQWFQHKVNEGTLGFADTYIDGIRYNYTGEAWRLRPGGVVARCLDENFETRSSWSSAVDGSIALVAGVASMALLTTL